MKILLLALSLFIGIQSSAQIVNLVSVAPLPAVANESSGLVKNGSNSFWTHNDSGGNPELYQFDSSGTLLRTLQLTNCTNVDWEELSIDDQGRLYIGDFGNNFNFRPELKIYRIPSPDSITGNTFAVQDTIRFNYPDQVQFPPPVSQWNYDLEAMAVFQDSIYLFTKNRTNPYTGYTRIYVIPASPGNWAAGLRDSIFTGQGTVDNFSITGAAIKSDGSRLILMSNLRMWLITNFSLPYFSQGIRSDFEFNTASQKEAVSIDNDSLIWFSDEGVVPSSGFLYRLEVDSLLQGIPLLETSTFSLYPNPCTTSFVITSEKEITSLMLLDGNRKTIREMELNKKSATINVESIPPGTYILKFAIGDGFIYRKLIIK